MHPCSSLLESTAVRLSITLLVQPGEQFSSRAEGFAFRAEGFWTLESHRRAQKWRFLELVGGPYNEALLLRVYNRSPQFLETLKSPYLQALSVFPTCPEILKLKIHASHMCRHVKKLSRQKKSWDLRGSNGKALHRHADSNSLQAEGPCCRAYLKTKQKQITGKHSGIMPTVPQLMDCG